MASAVCPTNTEVTIGVERWKSISQGTLIPFKDKDTKMINEFAFMWGQGRRHGCFKSLSLCTLSKCSSPDVQRKEPRISLCTTLYSARLRAICCTREGNVEQIFSLGGRLSDPNMQIRNMNPAYASSHSCRDPSSSPWDPTNIYSSRRAAGIQDAPVGSTDISQRSSSSTRTRRYICRPRRPSGSATCVSSQSRASS